MLPEDQSKTLFPNLLYGNWWKFPVLFMAALAWFATPLIMLRSVASESVAWLGGSVSLIVFCTLIFLSTRPFCCNLYAKIPLPKLPKITIIIGVGLLLRIIWISLFPAQPASDGATYLGLAQHILSAGSYEAGGTKAYWPPGYPFFLTPWLTILPAHYAVILSQLTLFILGCLGCYRLAYTLNGERAAQIAALLFAIWPNLVTQAGIPSKEILVIALLPWAFFFALNNRTLSGLFSGILLGCSTLVQPSTQLLIVATALLILFLRGATAWKSAALLIIGAALVITPWTIRNYQTFGHFVLVSTNGGDNLYRANNPLATGAYTPVGQVDLSKLSELEIDMKSKKLAKQWIIDNPSHFLGLVVEKQILFMSEDATGVYETLKRGKASDNSLIYLILKSLSNAWWLFIWAVIAIFIVRRKQHLFKEQILFWPWLYLFVIHSVFESAGKYHGPMLWVLCVLLAGMIAKNTSCKCDEK